MNQRVNIAFMYSDIRIYNNNNNNNNNYDDDDDLLKLTPNLVDDTSAFYIPHTLNCACKFSKLTTFSTISKTTTVNELLHIV